MEEIRPEETATLPAEEPQQKGPGVALRIARSALLAVVFLVPAFFFSFAASVYELPKALVFYAFTLIAAGACAVDAVLSKRATVRLSIVSIIAIVFLVIVLIATLFSEAPWASFLGATHFSGTLVSAFFLVVFFFTLTALIQSKKDILWVIGCFFASAVLVSVLFLLAIFNIQLTPALNLIAESFSIFGAFLAVAFTIGFGFLLFSRNMKWRLALLLANIAVYASLFILDEIIAWILVVIGLFFWLVYISAQSKKFASFWVLIPTILIVLSLLLSFVATDSLTGVSFVRDSTLDLSTSLGIAKNTFSRSFLLGSGPETYSIAFSQGRSVSFNDSSLWYLRFGKSGNELLQLFSTIGVFGLACFVLMGVILLAAGFWRVFKTKKGDSDSSALVLVLFPLSLIFLASLFTPFSVVLSFVFWFFLGLGVSVFKSREFKLDLAKSPAHNFVFSLAFALFVIVGVSFAFLAGKLAIGEYYAYQADKAISYADDLKVIEDNLKRAVSLNSWRSDFHMALAENYAVQAQQAVLAQDTTLLSSMAQSSLVEIDQALLADGKNPAVYDQSISTLRLLSEIAPDIAYNRLLAVYNQALAVDPANPYLVYSFGDVLLASAENIAAGKTDEELTEQEKQSMADLISQSAGLYQKAVDLKSYYIPAELRLSYVGGLLGKTDQSIARIDGLLIELPANADLLQESGRLHFLDSEIDTAKDRFNRILSSNPESIDARYYLALCLEAEGNTDQAIAELEFILDTSMGNEAVVNKLAELKGEGETE